MSLSRRDLQAAIRSDFGTFVRKALPDLEPNIGVLEDQYIDVVCYQLTKVFDRQTRRLIINMPPGFLKTMIASIAFAAWVLGRRPSTKLLIVCGSEQLAKDIAFKIRQILRMDWFQATFPTRLARDRYSAADFVTTQGGALMAVPITGSITGLGGHLIIVDDPAQIADAQSPDRLQRINTLFDTLVRSRLRNPAQGCIVVIQHRLGANDLSGHLHRQGGWHRLKLELVATRERVYKTRYSVWCRPKGHVLRADAYPQREIAILKRRLLCPDFKTLYQQSPSAEASFRPEAKYFRVNQTMPGQMPVVLSVDPGQIAGEGHAYSVVQAWASIHPEQYLLDQYRAQAELPEVKSAITAMVRKFRVAAILVENTAQGPSLVTALTRHYKRLRVIPITPDRTSKSARLYAHRFVFWQRRIILPQAALWVPDFIREFVDFPDGTATDQVDAATQFLDFIATRPRLEPPPPREHGVGVALASNPEDLPFPRGAVAIFHSQGRRW